MSLSGLASPFNRHKKRKATTTDEEEKKTAHEKLLEEQMRRQADLASGKLSSKQQAEVKDMQRKKAAADERFAKLGNQLTALGDQDSMPLQDIAKKEELYLRAKVNHWIFQQTDRFFVADTAGQSVLNDASLHLKDMLKQIVDATLAFEQPFSSKIAQIQTIIDQLECFQQVTAENGE